MRILTLNTYKLGWLIGPALLFVLVLGTCKNLWAQARIPSFDALVTDIPGVLSADKKADLEQKLRDLKLSKGIEIAVLIVSSLEGNSSEGYAQDVVRKWKIGEKGKDNGILLLVAIQERSIRIEIGRGLEGSVPDVIAGRIIRDEMIPQFRNGQVPEGIALGVQRLIEISSSDVKTNERASTSDPINTFWVFIVIGIVVAQILKAALGNTLGPLSAGIAVGIIGALSLGVLWGILLFFLVPLFSSGGSYRGGSGGWGGGGFSGGSGGGSISFGGGGTFSGGGASGRW